MNSGLPHSELKMAGVVKGLFFGAFKITESTFYAGVEAETDDTSGRLDDWAGLFDLEVKKIKDDNGLKVRLCRIICQEWPFSWVRGQTAFLDTVKREISHELSDQIMKAASNESLQPSIYVTLHKVDLKKKKISKKAQMDFRTYLGLYNDTLCPTKAIPFENKAKDELGVDIRYNDGIIGTALIPLSEVTQGQEQRWLIKGCHNDNTVGHLHLSVDFVNEDQPSFKVVAQQRMIDHMLELVSELFEDEQTGQIKDQIMEATQPSYGVVITEHPFIKATEKNEQTKTSVTLKTENPFGKPTIHFEGDLPPNESLFVPLEDLTTQKLELTVSLQRKGKKKSLDFDRFKKPSIGEDLYNLLNLSGDNKQGKSDCGDDMTTAVNLCEIPFKEGLSLNWREDLRWDLKIVAKSDEATLDLLKRLTFLKGYMKGVQADTLMNCLRPFFSEQDWFVADLNSKIKLLALNGHSEPAQERAILKGMKMLEDPDKLDDECTRFFKSLCYEAISSFNVRQLIDHGKGKAYSVLDEEIKRSQLLIEALMNLCHGQTDIDREGLKERMKAYVSKVFRCPQNDPHEKAKTLLEMIDNYGLLTLQTVQKRFSSFALTVWCPLLSEAILEVIVPEIKAMITSPFADLDVHKALFSIYKQSRIISKYSDHQCDDIITVFQPCLSSWADCAASIAKDRVLKTLELKKKDHQAKNSSSISNTKWKMSPADIENWKESAMNTHGIFYTCHQTWTELDWPRDEQSLQFGTELLHNINQVFRLYIEGMYNIIMQDEKFDHFELVLALNSLYRSSAYQKDFRSSLLTYMEKLAMKDDATGSDQIQSIYGLFAQAEEDLEIEAEKMIDLFCQGQRPKFGSFIKRGQYTRVVPENIYENVSDCYFDEESDEETDYLLGYLNALLKFFHLNLDIENNEITAKHKKNIKDQLFDLLEEEMVKNMEDKKLKKTILPELYEALEQAILFRRNVSLKESSRLTHAKNQIWIKKAKSHQLISEFVKNLNLSGEQPTGQLKMSVGKRDSKMVIALRSVSKLVPRLKKDGLDFSMTLSILPGSKDAKEAHKTKIYKDTTCQIFDMDQDSYKFELNLDPDLETYLQIVLYDHSMTRTNKIFRGVVIIPTDKIAALGDNDINASDYVVSAQFRPYPKFDSESEKLWPIWTELRSRIRSQCSTKFCFDVMCYTNEMRRPDIRN